KKHLRQRGIWQDGRPGQMPTVEVVASPGKEPPLEAERFAAGIPASLTEIRTGDDIVRHDHPWSLPGPIWLAVILLVPPLLCIAWYHACLRSAVAERRRHTGKLSRAGRRALRSLRLLPADAAREPAAFILLEYLQERFAFLDGETTPAEMAEKLRHEGIA